MFLRKYFANSFNFNGKLRMNSLQTVRQCTGKLLIKDDSNFHTTWTFVTFFNMKYLDLSYF